MGGAAFNHASSRSRLIYGTASTLTGSSSIVQRVQPLNLNPHTAHVPHTLTTHTFNVSNPHILTHIPTTDAGISRTAGASALAIVVARCVRCVWMWVHGRATGRVDRKRAKLKRETKPVRAMSLSEGAKLQIPRVFLLPLVLKFPLSQ